MWDEMLTTENLVALGLVVALIISLFTGTEDLSMAIASGLIGYLGRGQIEKMKLEDSKKEVK